MKDEPLPPNMKWCTGGIGRCMLCDQVRPIVLFDHELSRLGNGRACAECHDAVIEAAKVVLQMGWAPPLADIK